MASIMESLKLLIFKKMKDGVEEILYEISHCQIYKFFDGEWSKTIIGGPLYLYKRDGKFYEHGLVMLKLQCPDDYSDYVGPFLRMWRQNDPFLMMRIGKMDIKGIWRYNPYWTLEFDQMVSFISKINQQYPKCQIYNYNRFGTLLPVRLMAPFQLIIYEVINNYGMPLSLPFQQKYQPTLQLFPNYYPNLAGPSGNSTREEDVMGQSVVHNDKPLLLLESFFTPQGPPESFTPSVKKFFFDFVTCNYWKYY